MITRLEALKRFLTLRESRAINGFASVFYRISRFFTMVAIEFQKDRCLVMATALTLTSILSLVPLMSVCFSIFSAFESFEVMKSQIEMRIFEVFIGSEELRTTVRQYIHTYTRATTKMEILSVLTLVVTIVLLFMAIEYSMSVIWSIRRRRGYFESLKAFTSVIVWGPLLMASSIYLTAYVSRQAYFRELTTNVWTLKIFRHGVSWLLFFLVYVLIPYTRVNMKSALLGSFVASNAWELAKMGFEIYLIKSVFYKTIYGQLSVIPIFLLWLYLTWVTLLFGAEVAYCHQYLRVLKRREDAFDDDNLPKGELGLALYLLMARRFHRGKEPVRFDELCKTLGVAPDLAREVFDRLEDKGLVVRVESEDIVFLPAKSLISTSLEEVYEALKPSSYIQTIDTVDDPLLEHVQSLLEQLQQAERAVLSKVSITQLICFQNGEVKVND